MKTVERPITAELDSLGMRFVELAESIAKRANNRGVSWFSAAGWEFTELDCADAAKVAKQIKDALREIDAMKVR